MSVWDTTDGLRLTTASPSNGRLPITRAVTVCPTFHTCVPSVSLHVTPLATASTFNDSAMWPDSESPRLGSCAGLCVSFQDPKFKHFTLLILSTRVSESAEMCAKAKTVAVMLSLAGSLSSIPRSPSIRSTNAFSTTSPTCDHRMYHP